MFTFRFKEDPNVAGDTSALSRLAKTSGSGLARFPRQDGDLVAVDAGQVVALASGPTRREAFTKGLGANGNGLAVAMKPVSLAGRAFAFAGEISPSGEHAKVLGGCRACPAVMGDTSPRSSKSSSPPSVSHAVAMVVPDGNAATRKKRRDEIPARYAVSCRARVVPLFSTSRENGQSR